MFTSSTLYRGLGVIAGGMDRFRTARATRREARLLRRAMQFDRLDPHVMRDIGLIDSTMTAGGRRHG